MDLVVVDTRDGLRLIAATYRFTAGGGKVGTTTAVGDNMW